MKQRTFLNTWSSLLRLVLVGTLPVMPTCLRAAVGSWDEPALDRWFHQSDPAPGLKDLMSTFSNYEPGADYFQARTGSFMLGFDTSDQIPLVAPQRYQINSIRFTLDYVDEARNVAYDPTPDDLAAILAGTDDLGKPVEMYGVGYDNDYDRLGFGANDSLPPEFEESSPLWPLHLPVEERTFNVYPLGDDGTGNLGNVFNSVGGEAILEYDPDQAAWEVIEVTKPAWNTTPWAVGTVDGLTAGQNIPALSVFEFDIDLTLPGVLEYFQETLAVGQVAIFVASLHDLSGFHEGGNPAYPAFHAKDSLWVDFGLASAPTLEIDYTILPDLVPGDFDNDGDVDGNDLAEWQAGYGSSTTGDADGDGDSDGKDLLIWQRNYTGPAALAAVNAVPEPASLVLVIVGIITGLTRQASSRWINQ